MSDNNIRILSEPISYQELKSIHGLKITGIYKIENLINHKVYIGQSEDIIRRLKCHSTQITNEHLHNSICKYGLDNFSFEVLKVTYDLNYWEIFLIQIYHATDDRFGYNSSPGGENPNTWINLSKEKQDEIRKQASIRRKGKRIPDEQRKKISETLKGRPSPNKGKKASNETKYKQSIAQKRRFENYNARKQIGESVKNSEKYKLSRQNPEFRKRMSEVNKGRILSKEIRNKISKSRLGKKMPEEYCIRMRQYMKGRKLNEEWKHKISESNKGKTKDYIVGSIWWNDGKKNYRSKECPFEGCVKGRLNFNNVGCAGMKWWTNDIAEVLGKECPEGFHRGKLPMKQETKDKLSKINIEKHKRS